MSKKILKRSLALGALMAFVITGSAFAYVHLIDTKYHELQGTDHEVTSTNIVKDEENRVLGGWYNNPTKSAETITPNLTISSGSWDTAAGGHYAKNYSDAITTSRESTYTMNIKGAKTYVYQVIGGSIANGTCEVDYLTKSTDLNITGGTFGVTNQTTNCPETMIVAGDLLKWYADGGVTPGDLYSEIDTTKLTIIDGTFDSLIIGGSAAIEYYSSNTTLGASVKTATTKITGGAFNKPIVAGGFAWGVGETSTVGTAELTISATGNPSGLEINANIYSGGVSSYEWNKNEPNAAKVTVSNVTINNATVNDIYGYEMGLTYDTLKDKDGNVVKDEKGKTLYEDKYFTLRDRPVDTHLTLTNVQAETVEIPKGSVILSRTADGETYIETLLTGKDDTGKDAVEVSIVGSDDTNDNLDGATAQAKAQKFVDGITVINSLYIDDTPDDYTDNKKRDLDCITATLAEGEVAGQIDFEVEYDEATGKFIVLGDTVTEQVNTQNDAIGEATVVLKSHWRAHMNDMNKRMGELRNANGEQGVWVRMVRGEQSYDGAKAQYNQYQLGYDEKLSVNKAWTVGAAVTFAEGDSYFKNGSTEDDSTAFAIYGSKLNNDGTFVDLIARYARLNSDVTVNTQKGDYGSNGYSVSAEFGKRFTKEDGLWIEPQLEFTYGSLDSAEYKLGGKTVHVGDIDSFIARAGFAIGKNIKQGNVYARASYLYDFDGETETSFSAGRTSRTIKEDLGGGWWEVGVGTNINLSKATYIYADIEKTFGGEVDTDWQWNLGVRYSF